MSLVRAALAAVAAGAFLTLPGCGQPESEAPEAGRIELVAAEELRSALEAQGGSVVLVNLWATWCAPCLKEIPELVRLEGAAADRGLVVLGVSLDAPPERSDVQAFRDRWFPAFRTYQSAEANWYAIAGIVDPDWSGLLPTTFLLARDGTLAATFTGAQTYETFAAAVETLL
jgi:thiol-disulfide isomerase/thioredoxin